MLQNKEGLLLTVIRNCPSISCILNLSSPWSRHLTPVPSSAIHPHCIWDIRFIFLIAGLPFVWFVPWSIFTELTNPDRRCGQHKSGTGLLLSSGLACSYEAVGTLVRGYWPEGMSPHLLSCHSLALGGPWGCFPVPQLCLSLSMFKRPRVGSCVCGSSQQSLENQPGFMWMRRCTGTSLDKWLSLSG